MRTRLIRPEFVSDETLAELDDGARLFYVGLWLLCDDDGYFEWRVRTIAAVLYPFRDDTARRADVERWLAELVDLGRVRPLECGAHGLVPTLPKHGIQGGSKAYTFRNRHRSTCLVRTSTDQSRYESVSVSVSESGRGGAIDADAPTRAMIEAGGFAAQLAHRNGRQDDPGGRGRKVPPTEVGSRTDPSTEDRANG